ncbi:MAG TPA: AbrB/MazE/SpoVT family DNA-binding domain-containing protein [Tepidiformaceae bacterium]|nr:AbrB/MazE/SpoVT family DNA-binding domain-containing protein [Tepidiformaceae bacterium]
MTRSTTITSKGQVTIPKEVRERLGLSPADRVEFEVRGDTAVMRRSGLRVKDVIGALPPLGLSDEEVRARIARERAERWRA